MLGLWSNEKKTLKTDNCGYFAKQSAKNGSMGSLLSLYCMNYFANVSRNHM